jgi:hypothetical protein
VTIHLHVEDVDTVFKQAVAAGAKVNRPVADQFYGDRMGGVEDRSVTRDGSPRTGCCRLLPNQSRSPSTIESVEGL